MRPETFLSSQMKTSAPTATKLRISAMWINAARMLPRTLSAATDLPTQEASQFNRKLIPLATVLISAKSQKRRRHGLKIHRPLRYPILTQLLTPKHVGPRREIVKYRTSKAE